MPLELTPEQYRRTEEEKLADYPMEQWLKDNAQTVQGHVRDLVATFTKDPWKRELHQAEEHRQAVVALHQRLFGIWRLEQRRLIERRCQEYTKRWNQEQGQLASQAALDRPRLEAEYGGPVEQVLWGLVAHIVEPPHSHPRPSTELEVVHLTEQESKTVDTWDMVA